MRVVELDMTNSSHQCPSQLQQHTNTNGRMCRIESENAMCSPRGGWTRSIIAESAISIAIDFEWDFFKLLLLWL